MTLYTDVLESFAKGKDTFSRAEVESILWHFGLGPDPSVNARLTQLERRVAALEQPPGKINISGIEYRIKMREMPYPLAIEDTRGNIYYPFTETPTQVEEADPATNGANADPSGRSSPGGA